MPADLSTVPPPAVPLRWSEDELFAVLSQSARRRIIQTLANGQGKTATDLRGAAGKRLDATLKDCSALVKAGFLQTAPDPQDGRKMRYTLRPEVPLVKTDKGWEMDFGCCVVRV